MNTKIKIPPVSVVFFAHLFSMLFPEILFSFYLILIISIIALYKILKLKNDYFWSLIIIGSFNSSFPNIYTINILKISLIYWIIVIFILTNIEQLFINKYNKNTLLLIMPLIVLYPVQIILGYMNKYSSYLFFVDVFSFSTFMFFILYGVLLDKKNRDNVLKIIKQYILIMYPIMILFSALIMPSAPQDLFYDEFSKFHAISFFPLLFYSNYSIKQKVYMGILYFSSLLIIGILGYSSSLNFILIAISIIFIIFTTNFKKTVVLLLMLILVILPLSIQFYSQASPMTKFKIKQIGLVIEKLKHGDIKGIPFSPKIRILEFMNSTADLNKNPIYLITGKGFGSYFTFTSYKFEEYGINKNDLVKRDAYPHEDIALNKYPRGHGFLSYTPIKLGFLSMLIIIISSFIAFFIKQKQYLWLSVAIPFYILTTFGYGYKNFLFSGLFIGIILSINFNEERKSSSLTKLNITNG